VKLPYPLNVAGGIVLLFQFLPIFRSVFFHRVKRAVYPKALLANSHIANMI
jgi:hypothetical protein